MSRQRTDWGSIILSILALMTFLSLFTVAGMSLLRQHSQSAGSQEKDVQASYIARAGLQLALEQLHLDPEWGSAVSPITLDVSEDGRFKAKLHIWNNFSGTSELDGPGAIKVQAGRVYVESTAIVLNQEIATNFGTASSKLVRPDVEMNYAIFDNDESMSQYEGDAWIDAYNSDTEGFPAFYNWETGQPTEPSSISPHDGRGGTRVRCNGDLVVRQPIFGDIFKPSGCTATAPIVYGTVHDDDSMHVPMVFKIPPAFESQPPLTPVFGTPLTPGVYADVLVPPGNILLLERGEYCFRSLDMRVGSEIRIVDDTTPPFTPAIVYIESEFRARQDVLLNMNADSGATRDPQARELQVYGTDSAGVTGTRFFFENGCRVRSIIAAYNGSFGFAEGLSGISPITSSNISPAGRHGVDFFGSIYGRYLSQQPGVRYHYDRALEGERLDGNVQWVLLNGGKISR